METTTTELTPAQIAEAVTNDPALSKDTVTFADKTYKVIYLPYKQQLKFYALMTPLFEALGSTLVAKFGGNSPAPSFDVPSLITYCGEDLPELAALILVQAAPEITVEFVADNAKSPFELALIVLAQIQKNEMITEISRFFVSILPLMKSAKGLTLAKK